MNRLIDWVQDRRGVLTTLPLFCAVILALSVTSLISASPVSKDDPFQSTNAGGTATPTATACPPLPPGPWAVRNPEPTGLYGSGAANDGTVVYVAGGSPNGGTTVNTFRSYNPSTNTWTTLAPMQDSVALAMVVYAPNTGKVYAFGGDYFQGSVSDLTRIYDPTANSWITGTVMPGVRWGMAGGYYNGKIYLAGGNDGGGDQATTWAYDPVANTWNTSLAFMPAGRNNPGSAVLNGHLYVAGGRTFGAAQFNLFDYDIAGNNWTVRASMPVARHAPGAAAVAGKLWVFGGGTNFAQGNSAQGGAKADAPLAFNTNYIYDPATDAWVAGPNLNVARAYIAGTGMGDTAIAIGGEDSFMAYLDTTETNRVPTTCDTPTPTNTPATPSNTPTSTSTFTATSTRTSTATHTAGPSPTPTPYVCPPGPPEPFRIASPYPTPAESIGVAAVGNLAYAAGGFVSGSVLDRFTSYDPLSNAWTTLGTMPVPADSPSVVYAPNVNKLYAFGGGDNTGAGLAVNRIYDLSAGTWSTGAPMPAGRTFMASGYYNGKIFLVGGSTSIFTGGEAQVWEYDPVANSYNTGRAGMPVGIGGAAFGIVNRPDGGHFYTIGGFNPTGVLQVSTYDYNIGTDSWSVRSATLPIGTSYPGSAVLGNRIMLIGGFTLAPGAGKAQARGKASAPDMAMNTTYIFDPASDSLSMGPALNEGRYLIGSTFVNGYIVAVGGYNEPAFVATNEVSLALPLCPTATPSATNTAPPTATNTPTATGTGTAVVATATPTTISTSTPGTPSPTTCLIEFTDVPSSNIFYTYIRCLACRGIISGYDDGTFRPFNDITRGQIAKIVSNAAGFGEDAGPQIYADVPATNPFYQFINRLTMRGHMGGYDCGGVGEPCNGTNQPYFRPYNPATRGQLSKIVANAAGITDPVPVGTQTYTDVPPSNTFYLWIERLTARGAMGGYDCGGDGEPCDPQNRPYFRPFANVTRAQGAKIIANTFFPNCYTLAR